MQSRNNINMYMDHDIKKVLPTKIIFNGIRALLTWTWAIGSTLWKITHVAVGASGINMI